MNVQPGSEAYRASSLAERGSSDRPVRPRLMFVIVGKGDTASGYTETAQAMSLIPGGYRPTNRTPCSEAYRAARRRTDDQTIDPCKFN